MLKIDGANEGEPYNILPSGIAFILGTDNFWVAINYTINETVPGSNVNGDRRLAVCRIDKSPGTSPVLN